jgi:hypothetical protein
MAASATAAPYPLMAADTAAERGPPGSPASQAPGDRDGAQHYQGGYEEGGSGKRDGGLADPSR